MTKAPPHPPPPQHWSHLVFKYVLKQPESYILTLIGTSELPKDVNVTQLCVSPVMKPAPCSITLVLSLATRGHCLITCLHTIIDLMTSVINTQPETVGSHRTTSPQSRGVTRGTLHCCWAPECSKRVWIFISYVYNLSEEIWAHLGSHLSGWSRMEQDCTSGNMHGEQIKGYQRNPVIARQLIVSPGTKQKHFFCLLIRLRPCGLLSRCACAWG